MESRKHTSFSKMSSSDSYYIDILTNIPIYLHQYVATTFYFIAHIGNFLSLLIFFKQSWRKNVCVFYFIVCIINNTIFLNSALLGSIFILGFNINVQNSSSFLCKMFYYVAYVTSTYFPLVLIFASIDRLLITSQNVDTRLYSSRRLAYLFSFTSLVLWLVFSLHVLIKVDVQQLAPTVFVCYYEFSQFYLNFFAYSTLVLSVVSPLVLIALSIFAYKNVRRIQTVPRQQRKQVRSMRKKDFQLLRCLYVHNIVFILCSVLVAYSIVYGTAVRYQEQTPWDQALNNFLNNMGSLIHHIPFGTSFFIFVCLSKSFRQELIAYFNKITGQNGIQPMTEEHNEQTQAQDHIELEPAVSIIPLNN